MPPLHPGDTFPELTLTVPGGQEIPVPGSFAGEFGLVLFNRGAWCPYCTAQLRAFERAGDSFAQAGIRVAAWSATCVSTPPRHEPLGHQFLLRPAVPVRMRARITRIT
jgi:peroxiredoxin